MCDDFIKTINDVDSIYGFIYECAKLINNLYDFIYGFIYECAKLINNLYEYNNYNYLAIKLCEEFVMPIIIITKTEHIEEYNRHTRDIINNLEDNTDIFSICSYLMNICKERFFELKILKNKKIY